MVVFILSSGTLVLDSRDRKGKVWLPKIHPRPTRTTQGIHFSHNKGTV